MFGFFKRQKKHPHQHEDDVLWVSDSARARGVLTVAQQHLSRHERVVVGTRHSADAAALLDARGGMAIEILEPHQLNPARLTEQARGSSRLYLLQVGVGTDADAEEKLLIQCTALPFVIHLRVHHSLDDALLKEFTSPEMRTMLERLGMNAEEPIVHRWVSRAISSARRKRRA